MELFPDPPRDFRGLRAVKIGLRAVHVLCAAVFASTYVLDAPAERATWLAAAVASGAALLALDLYRTAAFVFQTRGLVLAAKLVGLALLPYAGDAAAAVVSALILLSVVSSHAPSRVRYFVIFGRGRIRGDDASG